MSGHGVLTAVLMLDCRLPLCLSACSRISGVSCSFEDLPVKLLMSLSAFSAACRGVSSGLEGRGMPLSLYAVLHRTELGVDLAMEVTKSCLCCLSISAPIFLY